MNSIDRQTRHRVSAFAAVILFVIGFATGSRAQEPEGRPRAGESAPSKSPDFRPPVDMTPLLQILQSLRDQVQELTSEVKRLRKAGERTNEQTELLLNEERLARVEDRIAAVNQRQSDLSNQEQALRYRQNNIENELLLRAPLNRDEVKAAIQSEIDRGFDGVHAEQVANQQRLADLQSDASRLRGHIDGLRKRLESTQDKPPAQN